MKPCDLEIIMQQRSNRMISAIDGWWLTSPYDMTRWWWRPFARLLNSSDITVIYKVELTVVWELNSDLNVYERHPKEATTIV